MKVLFRAQVVNIGSLAEKFIKKLMEIDGRFYCIGFESLLDGEYTIIDQDGNCFECIYDTRAIHFENMIDSNNNPIFASLSEDGKGGDIMKDDEYYGIAKYKDSRFVVEYENVEECLYEGNFEVIGIQE